MVSLTVLPMQYPRKTDINQSRTHTHTHTHTHTKKRCKRQSPDQHVNPGFLNRKYSCCNL
jgi:hypothetical protein